MRKKEIENLIKENFKDTALRIYELDNEDRKSLLEEYREWIMNDLDSEEVMMLPYEAYTDKLDPNYLDDLEEKSLSERKKEKLLRRKLSGNNLGGRPKISPLKESLVIRLRNEGYSYRSIRSQTGIALSTIRRVILEGELT